jgi:transposase-like protein
MSTKKHFTKEFKLGILRNLETGRLSEICRANDLNPSTVCGWKRDYDKNPKKAFSGHGNVWKDEAQIAIYERKIGQQALEIDLLKKTYESLKRQLGDERGKTR